MYNKQKLPKSEKREREKGEEKKAFESVIDEVALFDFKDSESRSGLVLALLSLFQWLKRST